MSGWTTQYIYAPVCDKPIEKLVNDPKLLIAEGLTKKIPNACSVIGKNISFKEYIPDNGEFEVVNTPESCYGWESGKKDLCYSPTSPFRGSSRGWVPGMKRIAYKGDLFKCCLGLGTIIDGNTCDPELTYTSDKCIDTLEKYCNNPNNLNGEYSIYCQSYKRIKESLPKPVDNKQRVANEMDCCIGKIDFGETCPNDLNKTSIRCKEVMTNYCNTLDKIQTDPKCDAFCNINENKEWCDNNLYPKSCANENDIKKIYAEVNVIHLIKMQIVKKVFKNIVKVIKYLMILYVYLIKL